MSEHSLNSHTPNEHTPSEHSRNSPSAREYSAEAIDLSQWQHFHKVTPLSKVGALWVVLVVIVFQMAQSLMEQAADSKEFGEALVYLFQHASFVGVLYTFGALVLLTAITLGFAYVSWKRQSYALVNSGIHYRAGVLIKTHTHMRWDRVQSVEVQQSFFGRIFGLGSVKVESAGNDQDMMLGLLRLRQCAELRATVLGVVDRVRSGYEPFVGDVGTDASAPVGKNSPSDTAASEGGVFLDADDLERDRLIFELSFGRLVASRILSWSFIVSALFLIAFVWGLLDSIGGHHAIPTGFFTVFIATAVPFIWSLVKSFNDDFGLKVFLSPNGLRRRAGLTKLVTVTYPPQRIHSVVLRRPLLWRKADWWAIDIVRAGVTLGEAADSASSTTAFVPVASRDDTLRLLWTLIPGLGTDHDLDLLAELLDGKGTGRYVQGAPQRARYFDPLGRQGRGIALTERVLILRSGRFARYVTIVFQDHTQSLHLLQGPFQARAGLGTLRADMVSYSRISEAKNLDIEQLHAYLHEENELSRLARKRGVSETLDEWKARVGVDTARA